MARAFLASVPLAVVLVAAVIVPVAVTPGSFGFHGWPEPPQELAGETPIVVQVAKQAPAAPARSYASRTADAHAAPAVVAQASVPATKPRSVRRDSARTTPHTRSRGREMAQAPAGPAPAPAPAPAAAPAPPQAPGAAAPAQVQEIAPQLPVHGHHAVFEARQDSNPDASGPGARADGAAHGGPDWSRGHRAHDRPDLKKRASRR